MTVLDLYEVMVWDGGEHHYPKFYFQYEKDAQEYVKAYPHDFYQKRQFKVYYSYEDFEDNTDDAIRKRALDKLTPEEKLVLGVK